QGFPRTWTSSAFSSRPTKCTRSSGSRATAVASSAQADCPRPGTRRLRWRPRKHTHTDQPERAENMSGRLDKKVCIITGTGGSMGREAALTFAREGALVVGCGLHTEDSEETVQLVRSAGGEMV